MTVSVREDRGCAVVTCEGTYTLSEAREAVMRSLAPFRQSPARGLIVDVTASDMLQGRSSADLLDTARLVSAERHAFSGRFVAVASSPLAFGLMRMSGAHAEALGVEAQVCRTYECAVDWVLEGRPAGAC